MSDEEKTVNDAAAAEAAAVVRVALPLAAEALDPATPHGSSPEPAEPPDGALLAGVTDGIRRGQIDCDADLHAVMATPGSPGSWVPPCDPSVRVVRADYPDPVLYAAAWERYARGWAAGFEALVRKRTREHEAMGTPVPTGDRPLPVTRGLGARGWGQVALGVILVLLGGLLLALGTPAVRQLVVLQWGVVLLGFVVALRGIGARGRS